MQSKTDLQNNLTVVKKNFNNRKIFIFFIAILVSTLLWLIKSMSVESSSIIEIKYKITNIPDNYYFDSIKNNSLKSNITASGYNIIIHKIKRIFPININFKDLQIYTENDSSNLQFIYTANIIPNIKDIFDDNIKIDSISPKKIYLFKKGSRLSKKVPVKIQFTYVINNDFILVNYPKFLNNNDSVFIEGPKEILTQINFVKTKNVDLGIISDTEPYNVELETNNNINYSTTNVQLYFPIEKYTEGSCEVPIEIKNFPADTKVTIIPQSVKISYKIPLSLFNKTPQNNFIATVDYNNKKSENKIFIDMVSKNKNIKISETLIPDYVKFIIEKN